MTVGFMNRQIFSLIEHPFTRIRFHAIENGILFLPFSKRLASTLSFSSVHTYPFLFENGYIFYKDWP